MAVGTFTVADKSVYSALELSVMRDDRVIVYLNGTEIFRDNMPAGAAGYRTLASAAIEPSGYLTSAPSPSLLVNGTHVVAVEIHQANVTSSDISLDLELSP